VDRLGLARCQYEARQANAPPRSQNRTSKELSWLRNLKFATEAEPLRSFLDTEPPRSFFYL
jgi:hypothetical protein